jgi:hypothetical protein
MLKGLGKSDGTPALLLGSLSLSLYVSKRERAVSVAY